MRDFLGSLVNSIHLGLIVVDRGIRVVVWNNGCEELWGLRSDETTGKVLTGLDIQLPMGEVKPLIGQAFVGPAATEEATIDAVNRRGRPTRVRVTCTAFRSADGSANGALLLMKAQPQV